MKGDFYIGVIEDRQDPKLMGRVRVRVLGLHSDDRVNDVPINTLPWSMVMMPADSSTTNGGLSRLVEGTWVMVVYFDNNLQDPIVVGSIPSSAGGAGLSDQFALDKTQERIELLLEELDSEEDPVAAQQLKISIERLREDEQRLADKLKNDIQGPDYTKGFTDPFGVYPRYTDATSDVSLVARPEFYEHPTYTERARYILRDIPLAKRYKVSTVKLDEADSAYERPDAWSEKHIRGEQNSVYPFNSITEYENGAIEEFDATSGGTRITRMHPAGTYEEILLDGTRTVKVVGDGYELTMGSKSMYIKGDLNVTVEGNMRQMVKGDYTLEVAGKYSTMVAGDRETKLMSNDLLEVGNDQAINIANNHNFKVGVDQTIIIGNDTFAKIGRDSLLDVGNNKSTVTANDSFDTVGNNHTIGIANNRMITTGGTHTLESVGNVTIDTDAKMFTYVALNKIVDVGGTIDCDAGGNIDMDASNIFLN